MRLFQFHNIHTQNMKFTTYIECKEKCKHENYFIHTKIRKNNELSLYRTFFFLLFSVDSSKQNKLVNNN